MLDAVNRGLNVPFVGKPAFGESEYKVKKKKKKLEPRIFAALLLPHRIRRVQERLCLFWAVVQTLMSKRVIAKYSIAEERSHPR